jgi:hypothetical protein
MKRLLFLSVFLLVNQIALAVDDNHQAVVKKNITAEEMAQWIATDGMEDSEESYYMHLISWLRNLRKADREAAFMKVILNIRLEAIGLLYRNKVLLSAERIGPVAFDFIQTRLAHIPPVVAKDDKRYRKLSDHITEELWFDSESEIKNGIKWREHEKFWRGYKLKYELRRDTLGRLIVFMVASDPIREVILNLPWGLRWSDGKVIGEVRSVDNAGRGFNKFKSIMHEFKLKQGLKYQLEWAYPGDN